MLACKMPKPVVCRKKTFACVMFFACKLALCCIEGLPRILLLPWLCDLSHGVRRLPLTFPFHWAVSSIKPCVCFCQFPKVYTREIMCRNKNSLMARASMFTCTSPEVPDLSQATNFPSSLRVGCRLLTCYKLKYAVNLRWALEPNSSFLDESWRVVWN